MNTTYDVVANRSGDWWTIEVTSGLPVNVLGVSQARRLTEVPQLVRRLLSDLVGADPSEVDVNVLVELPLELQQMVEQYREAEVVEKTARTEAALARSRSAAAFMDAHLTMREAGAVLGVSHQRIKQLVDRAPDAAHVDLLALIEDAVEKARRERKKVLRRPQRMARQ